MLVFLHGIKIASVNAFAMSALEANLNGVPRQQASNKIG